MFKVQNKQNLRIKMFAALLIAGTFLFLNACQNTEQVPQNTTVVSSDDTKTVRYHDGTYSALSTIKDERGGSAKVTLTIKGGEITAVDFILYDKDGKVKDETYGKAEGGALYKRAQEALSTAKEYAAQLLAKQKIEDVDAIAGATMNYDLFKNVVEEALNMALQGPETGELACGPGEGQCDIALPEVEDGHSTQSILESKLATDTAVLESTERACCACKKRYAKNSTETGDLDCETANTLFNGKGKTF